MAVNFLERALRVPCIAEITPPVPHLHKEVSGEAQVAMFSVQRISQLLVALLQANTGQ
jgi:hypothetical protein